MSRPRKSEPIEARTILELTKEQKDLLESAREIVRINGLSTTNKSVILFALKFFVEEKTKDLKEQYRNIV